MKTLHRRITTLQGEYVQNFERTRVRLFMVTLFFAFTFAVIAGRLFYLMGPTAFHTKAPRPTYTSADNTAPKRADIMDRNGIILATSLVTQSLYADPKLVDNPAELAAELHDNFPDLNEKALAHDLSQPRRFIWVKRHLTPKQQARVLAIGDPALAMKSEYRRLYPQSNLISHIAGYTNTDGIGIAGIERQYNDRLLTDGTPLQLTIDTRLQYILKSEMEKSIKHFNAIGGSGIVMNVQTGEILAMVSLPDFDPHRYNTADPNAQFNRNTVGVYEMGSTFKIFSTAAALNNGTAELPDMFDVREPLKIGRFRIHDYHAMKRKISLAEVFIESSNIGTALMADEMGGEKLQAFFNDLGFSSKPVIDLPERSRPIVPARWRRVTTMTASYGHGIAVTPVHVARAVAAIVNGGILPQPHLAARKNQNKPPTPGVSIISPQTSSIMRGLLALTVEKGTGSKVKHDNIWVGGKTGTAEKAAAHGYAKNKLFSSFAGVFPADNPQYVILVAIDEPKGTKDSFGYATGGWTSAPVVGKVVEYMAPMMTETRHLEKKPFPAMEALLQYVKEEEDQ